MKRPRITVDPGRGWYYSSQLCRFGMEGGEDFLLTLGLSWCSMKQKGGVIHGRI